MRRKIYGSILGLAALAVAAVGVLAFSSAKAAEESTATYQVTITNLTRGQIFSPPVVALHNNTAAPLFTLGSPASAELAALAEDGMTGPLETALQSAPGVGAVEAFGGPLLPGGTASIEISATGPFNLLSLAGMLVTTNDAFFALNGAAAAKGPFPITYYSPAYDAGSEANNEDCAFIPGPPCGNAGVRSTPGEGYVHIHAGIHGVADLTPADHDWRNPVALITVRRMNASQ
ncbi:MAG: hypothetical protein FJ316_08540 [SAR202 cluster bacterium]|nr:hypothetical protein [SAR202 cluster bacterium]